MFELLIVGGIVGAIWWWHSKSNAAGASVLSSGWTLVTGTQTVGAGTYRISIPVPASAGAPPETIASAIQQAAQLVGWTAVTVYMPSTTFPGDWPDSDPTELRLQMTLPTGKGPLPIPAPPSSGAKVWFKAA